MEWNVYYYDINRGEIRPFNIFNHFNFKNEVIDLIGKARNPNGFRRWVVHIGSNHTYGKYLDTNLCKNCVDELFLIVKDFCYSTIEDFTKLK